MNSKTNSAVRLKNRKVTVTLWDDTDFEFGTKLYAFDYDPNKSVYFKEDGKIATCKGERIFTELEIKDYFVRRYIICSAEMDAPNYESAYTEESVRCNGNHAKVYWSGCALDGFEKGRFRRRFMSYDVLEQNPEKVKVLSIGTVNTAFYDKSTAEKFIKELHKYQKGLLDEYNKKHGTSYEYPLNY